MAGPRVAVVTAQRWPSAGMMARALHLAGFDVAAVAPYRHPLRTLSGLARHWTLRSWAPAAAIDAMLTAWSPSIVVPCDDVAVDLLHETWRRHRGRSDAGSARTLAVLEDSLGDPATAFAGRRKSEVLALAAEHGLATPHSRVVEGGASLRAAVAGMSFPLLLKADDLWGGIGVRVCADLEAAEVGFEQMRRPPSWGGAAAEALRVASAIPLHVRSRFVQPTISVQEIIAGTPANFGALCWRGRVLAGYTHRVLASQRNNGPASLVRIAAHEAIAATAASLAGLLRLSGFCGFDFIIEEGTGRAVLLEINPRMTSASYVTPTGATPLAARLHRHLTGGAAATDDRPVDEIVALFPQELERDRHSPNLHRHRHDVPWDEPEFVRACIGHGERADLLRRSRLTRLRHRMPRRPMPSLDLQ